MYEGRANGRVKLCVRESWVRTLNLKPLWLRCCRLSGWWMHAAYTTHTHTHTTFTGTAHTSTPLHQWAEMEGLTPGGCGIVIRDWTNTARPRLLLSRVSSAELWAEGVCPCQSCNYITAHVVVGQQKPPTKNKKTEKLACVWRCVWRERTDKDTVTLYQAEGGPLPVVIRVCVYLHDRCFTWCVWLQHVCVQFPGLGGS